MYLYLFGPFVLIFPWELVDANTGQLSISCKKCSVLQVGKGKNNPVYCLVSQPITATDDVYVSQAHDSAALC